MGELIQPLPFILRYTQLLNCCSKLPGEGYQQTFIICTKRIALDALSIDYSQHPFPEFDGYAKFGNCPLVHIQIAFNMVHIPDALRHAGLRNLTCYALTKRYINHV